MFGGSPFEGMGTVSSSVSHAVPTRAPRSRSPSLRRTRTLATPVCPEPVWASNDAPIAGPA
eukprot:1244326-Heterocapsa_arctica.AAC.1